MSVSIKDFRLPGYREIPDVGLYLDQTVKYINRYLAPLGCMEITTSMVSNYVKKGLVDKPIKKQYYAEHIAYLLFIVLAKNLMSIENIRLLIQMQKRSYTSVVAYDYLCCELENILMYLFGVKSALEDLGDTQSAEKDVLRNLVFSAAHMIYMNVCLKQIQASSVPAEN